MWPFGNKRIDHLEENDKIAKASVLQILQILKDVDTTLGNLEHRVTELERRKDEK